jgi:hypothetical protein
MSYAFYIHHLDLGILDAQKQIAKTKNLDPALDVEFRIYYANQISNQSQEVDFLGLGIKLDVATVSV